MKQVVVVVVSHSIHRCQNCNEVIETKFFCEYCSSFQDLTKFDYFDIFGQEISITIDKSTLEKNYFALQTIFHPDKATHLSFANRKIIIENSMIINKAYSILKNDYKRLFYLLKLKGFDIEDERKSKIKADLELLEYILEEREKLESIHDEREIEQFKDSVLEEIKKLFFYFEEYYEEDIEKAISVGLKVKYLSKILEEVKLKVS